jgi:hypothetical protein
VIDTFLWVEKPCSATKLRCRDLSPEQHIVGVRILSSRDDQRQLQFVAGFESVMPFNRTPIDYWYTGQPAVDVGLQALYRLLDSLTCWNSRTVAKARL